MQEITLVTPTFGTINVVPKFLDYDPNTLIIGDKVMNLEPILPDDINLSELDDFHIIIWDGMRAKIEVVINPNTYVGEFDVMPGNYQRQFVNPI